MAQPQAEKHRYSSGFTILTECVKFSLNDTTIQYLKQDPPAQLMRPFKLLAVTLKNLYFSNVTPPKLAKSEESKSRIIKKELRTG
jgi:hypothetical protein